MTLRTALLACVALLACPSLGSFLRQVQNLGSSGGSAENKLIYRLKGTAFVDSPSSFKLPFDEKGEVDMPLGSAPQN